MKALQCVELAGPEKLLFGDVDDPELGSGQVLVEIKAASVNFPDVLMIQGLYQFQPPMPFIPGAECSGVIAEIGEGVESCKVGDHVFVMAGNGCFAEKLVVDAVRVSQIPKEMDLDLLPSEKIMQEIESSNLSFKDYGLKQSKNIAQSFLSNEDLDFSALVTSAQTSLKDLKNLQENTGVDINKYVELYNSKI